MALATYALDPQGVTILAGEVQGFTAFSSNGQLALINNAIPIWQNLVNAAVDGNGTLARSGGTPFAWDSGATSSQSIAGGDGYIEFICNVLNFGGRQFLAGLTSLSTVAHYVDVDFAIQAFEGGISIFESGTHKVTPRAARPQDRCYVGIENGRVVYRVNGEIVYQATTAPTYPLRLGVAFLNPTDSIGGLVDESTVTWEARSMSGVLSGSWSTSLSASQWTSPATRGRYKITARSANNVITSGLVNVHKIFPGLAQGFPRPGRFRELPSEYKVNEQIFDDGAAEYLVPLIDGRVRRWRLEYTGATRRLSPSQAQVLDDFFHEHRSSGFPFYFKDERQGITYDNVRFARYEANHGRLAIRQERIIELIRRPA